MIKTVENSQRVIVGTDSALSPPPLFHPPSLPSQCQLSLMSVSVLMMLPYRAQSTVIHLSCPDISLFICRHSTNGLVLYTLVLRRIRNSWPISIHFLVLYGCLWGMLWSWILFSNRPHVWHRVMNDTGESWVVAVQTKPRCAILAPNTSLLMVYIYSVDAFISTVYHLPIILLFLDLIKPVKCANNVCSYLSSV